MSQIQEAVKRLYMMLTDELNVSTFESRHYELTRGAKTSNGDGRRNAETPLPQFDRYEKQLRKNKKDHDRAILSAVKLIERAIQREKLLTAIPAEEARKLANELESPTAKACSNCHRVVENTPNDRVFGGRCRNCHDYLKNHGSERPRELWESEIDKQAAKLNNRGLHPQGR